MSQLLVDNNTKVNDLLDVLEDQDHLNSFLQYCGCIGDILIFNVIKEDCLPDEKTS